MPWVVIVALVKQGYSSEDAYEMLEEVKEKIYFQYPKAAGEGEALTGAKMYVSEIVQKFNGRSSKIFDTVNQNDIVVNVNENPSGAREMGSAGRTDAAASKLGNNFNNAGMGQEETVVCFCYL